MVKECFPRKITYEGDLTSSFAKEFTSKPGGETLSKCIQCGTCSATCPLSIYMDYTPRRIIAMVREGFRDEVLKSFTIWLCASCYSCTASCPKEIKITDLMYNLKREAIREKTHPPGFTIPVLAKEFFASVAKHGRMSEGRVVMRMYLKTNPLKHIGKSFLGLKLFLKGRMAMNQDTIKNRKQLKRLLTALDRRAAVLRFPVKEAL